MRRYLPVALLLIAVAAAAAVSGQRRTKVRLGAPEIDAIATLLKLEDALGDRITAARMLTSPTGGR